MATNIKATLTLDPTQYQRGINKAESDTKRFVRTTENASSTAAAAFNKIGSAIAAIGVTALIAKVNAYADAVTNMGRASELGSNGVLAVQEAFISAGGTADRARDAISDFTKNMGEAQLGSEEMANSLAKANLSLKDIQSLPASAKLLKVVEGLNAIKDTSVRTATAYKVFGESVKGVDLQQLESQLKKAATTAQGSQTSIDNASKANSALAANMERLTKALLDVIEPLNKMIANINVSVETFTKLINILVYLGGAFLIFKKVLPLVQGATNAWAGLGSVTGAVVLQFEKIGGAFVRAGKHLLRMVGLLPTAYGGFASLGFAISQVAKGLLRFAGVVGIALAVFDGLNLIIEKLTGLSIGDWFDKGVKAMSEWVDKKFPALAKALGWLKDMFSSGPKDDGSYDKAELAKFVRQAKEAEEKAKALTAAQAELTAMQKKMQAEFAATTAQLDQQTETLKDNLRFQASIVGYSTDLADKQTQLREATKGYTDEINKQKIAAKGLQDIIAAPASTDAEKSNAKAKLGLINEQIQKLEEAKNKTSSSVQVEIEALQKKKAAHREFILGIEQSVALEYKRAEAFGYSLSELDKFNLAANSEDWLNKTAKEIELLGKQAKAIDAITAAALKENLLGERAVQLSELKASILGVELTAVQKLEQEKLRNPTAFARKTEEEKKLLEETAKQLDSTTEKYRAYAFARELGRNAADFKQSLQDEMALSTAISESARRRLQIEIDGRTTLEEKIRSINDRYGDEMSLSEDMRAARAREIEDAKRGYTELINYKTKLVTEDQKIRDSFEFGWGEAFRKYAEDANNAAGQARTYFDTFAKGFEDAIVNFVQTGKLSFKDLANTIIAEFARIQAKKMLSGIMSGVGGGGGGGLFSSIGKLFGFANGGNPAIGKPMIVGENGPELMVPRNASTIIPNGSLGGGGTVQNITYNIQATDAQSFKQQLARDPSFVHAVVEQGRRSTPTGARR